MKPAERRRWRTGVCVDCGATTRYNGNRRRSVDDGVSDPASSERCPRCTLLLTIEGNRGTGKRQQELVRYLADHGSVRFSEIPEVLGIKLHSVGQLVKRLQQNGMIVRSGRGVYRLP